MDTQGFSNLRDALSLKSSLEQVSDRYGVSDSVRLMKLDQEDEKTVKATRHSPEVIQAAGVMAEPSTQTGTLQYLKVFYEPAERLVFAIFNRLFKFESKPERIINYVIELILLFLLAAGVIVFMWYQALLGS